MENKNATSELIEVMKKQNAVLETISRAIQNIGQKEPPLTTVPKPKAEVPPVTQLPNSTQPPKNDPKSKNEVYQCFKNVYIQKHRDTHDQALLESSALAEWKKMTQLEKRPYFKMKTLSGTNKNDKRKRASKVEKEPRLVGGSNKDRAIKQAKGNNGLIPNTKKMKPAKHTGPRLGLVLPSCDSSEIHIEPSDDDASMPRKETKNGDTVNTPDEHLMDSDNGELEHNDSETEMI